jgi:hypothetical protein
VDAELPPAEFISWEVDPILDKTPRTASKASQNANATSSTPRARDWRSGRSSLNLKTAVEDMLRQSGGW